MKPKPKRTHQRATWEEILAGKKAGRGHTQAKTHPWKSPWKWTSEKVKAKK